MSSPATVAPSFTDIVMIKIAREIAMGIRSVPQILETHRVADGDWETMSTHPIFQTYLRQSVEEWHSATNTPERVKLKSMAFIEEALPEFFARAHDPKEPLAAKTEVLKTVAKFAGVGGTVDGTIAGERMVVNINLGADHNLRIERSYDIIEGEASE
jgi:hypothetical protein